MSGFQFIHIESYARTAAKGKTGNHSVSSIVAEARRDAGHSPHVESPQSPLYLQGASLDVLEATCEAYAATITDTKGRKMRRDGLCLLAGVVSAPDDFTEAQWSTLSCDTLNWLKKRFEDRLRTTVAHLDESHDHLHFFIVPRDGERFDEVHPGKAAARRAKTQGLAKGDQNKAYIAAMRAFQDDFFEEVGARNGLARIGPGRRRLTRAEWKQEQNTVERVGQAIKQAEDLKLSALDISASARIEAESLRKAAVLEAQKIADEALKAADLAQSKAEADAKLVISDAEQKASDDAAALWNRVSQDAALDFAGKSLWGKLGAMITGLKRERDDLQKLVKKLTRRAEKSAELLKARDGHINDLMKWAGSIKSKMDKAIEDRKKAQSLLNRANIDKRELKREIVMLRERYASHAKLESELYQARNERDFERAKADQMSRYIAKIEVSQKAQDAHTLPSIRRSHVELEQTI
ncbi:plasmid recombination protein [Pseudomonas putida]|uniref:plasmid recombination protein n=1 Tax=Pseudomonas putida TaxID=303 RepID=UPI0009020220|nr:plasmid recombination protein [Pseudomonas putida]APE97090.1 hypothetical protein BG030_02980 [Pseudomonas putida]